MGNYLFFDQQPRHLLEGSEFNFKILPNIGLKVAAESRTAESPIVNIFAKTIFGHIHQKLFYLLQSLFSNFI